MQASDQTNSPASPMAKGTAKGAAGGGASAAAAAADAGKNASAIQGLSQQVHDTNSMMMSPSPFLTEACA